jgi:uncharacterized protein
MREHQPTHLDPRAPLVLDTKDLPRSPGSMRTLERVVPAPEGLGLDLIGVPAGEPVTLTLRMESVSEGVLVSARAQAAVRGECGRCLREIADTIDVEFQQLYAYPSSSAGPGRSDERGGLDEADSDDDIGHMQGDLIDLEPELRDAVVLALPLHPRCREDCPGLCSECGTPWDELPADHSHDRVDPRWAALSRLKST